MVQGRQRQVRSLDSFGIARGAGALFTGMLG
jgi:hypothetical protein